MHAARRLHRRQLLRDLRIHQPHDADAKLAPFPSSEAGISGLETLLPLTLRLVDENEVELPEALSRLTQQPATVLGILENGLGGSLGIGARADICIFDPDQYWELNENSIVSRGHNSPFIGWEMKGRVTHTLVAGQLKFGQ